MYLSTTKKKRLVAAVTLSIISSASFAVPAFAASAGTVDHPMQYESYLESDDHGDIAQKREDHTGESVNCTPIVRQYDILKNNWGDFLCQREYRTKDIRQSLRSL